MELTLTALSRESLRVTVALACESLRVTVVLARESRRALRGSMRGES